MSDIQHTIFPTLAKLFPDNTTDLHRDTPFQLLIAVMMSAQTTDIQVNKVTDILFKTVHLPQDVIDMGQKTYNTAISSIGLHNSKSKHIYQTAQILIDLQRSGAERVASFFDDNMTTQKTFDPSDPHTPTLTNLTSLPGVGTKTAKVVLHVLRHAPHIAVDTHVHRVSNRLGLVDTNTPTQTDKILESIIRPEYKQLAHHTLIFFGRYHCTARKPTCSTCPLYDTCSWSEKAHYHG